MVGLGQKLKMPKTREKAFYKTIGVILCKKLLEKKNKYSRNETILKIAHLAKAIAHAKPLQNGRFGSKIKNAKNTLKTILEEH